MQRRRSRPGRPEDDHSRSPDLANPRFATTGGPVIRNWLAALAVAGIFSNGFAAGGDDDERIDAILAQAEKQGVTSVFERARDLRQLGTKIAPGLKAKVKAASPVGKLTLGRALIELSEIDDARDAVLAVAQDGQVDRETRRAAIQIVG